VPPSPPAGPVPVAAALNGAGPATVTFDQPLVPGALDPANWFLRFNNTFISPLVIPGNPSAAGSTVSIIFFTAGPDPGPDVVSFSPPPNDVVSLATAIPAAAFSDFPLAP